MHACKYDVISYKHYFHSYNQSLSVVASVHCFSAEGLHFSALVRLEMAMWAPLETFCSHFLILTHSLSLTLFYTHTLSLMLAWGKDETTRLEYRLQTEERSV